jgi:hypothetical protein
MLPEKEMTDDRFQGADPWQHVAFSLESSRSPPLDAASKCEIPNRGIHKSPIAGVPANREPTTTNPDGRAKCKNAKELPAR